MRTNLDIRYVAGLFDGEGCVSILKNGIGRRNPLYQLHAIISMTHKVTLQRIRQRFGGSLYEVERDVLTRQTSWRLDISGLKARIFFCALYPYVVIKKKVVTVALRLYKVKDESNAYRDENRTTTIPRRFHNSYERLYKQCKKLNSGKWKVKHYTENHD